jgi:hypothetical protein
LLAHLADPGHNTIFAVSQLSSLFCWCNNICSQFCMYAIG